jgi:hypothetical protein
MEKREMEKIFSAISKYCIWLDCAMALALNISRQSWGMTNLL